ncbi:hypothetical protein Bca4012_025525 [Brassica carinata]|uniref:Uncharacterized protein n=1 Tax=Brassica carinata TaxID=52824 RepID=A0A8X8ATJ7_BRACI|nr:hypothetical protein Bca52824_022620 [Brassica carinata]
MTLGQETIRDKRWRLDSEINGQDSRRIMRMRKNRDHDGEAKETWRLRVASDLKMNGFAGRRRLSSATARDDGT